MERLRHNFLYKEALLIMIKKKWTIPRYNILTNLIGLAI